jgi:hypothetical protein
MKGWAICRSGGDAAGADFGGAFQRGRHEFVDGTRLPITGSL